MQRNIINICQLNLHRHKHPKLMHAVFQKINVN